VKTFRSLVLCLTLCLLLSACGGGASKPDTPPDTPPAQEQPSSPAIPLPDKNTLVIAIADEVEGLDVQQISYGNMVHDLICEPLVTYSTDLTELCPSFAESYTLANDYLEFVLPADAKFSNGDPLDAEAVKASVERFMEISEYAGDLDTVSGIEVIDARSVRFHLSAPAPYSLATIASLFCGIVDVQEVERIGEWEFNRRPVMNGEYYVEDWVAGSHLVLKRNEYFHTSNPALQNHGPVNLETLVIRFIPSADERMRAMENGEVDFVYHAPTNRWAELKANHSYNVYSYLQPGVCYLNLQTGKGVLEDIAVRQALTFAVNREEIKDAMGGIVEPSYGFLVPSQTGYSAEEEARLAEKLRYDPARAEALLAEAGWKDTDGDGILEKNGVPLQIEMMLPADRVSFAVAGPVLERQFAAIGADVHAVYYEADYVKELMRSDEYEIGSRAYEWNDADILYWCFTEDSSYVWDDPELTALLTTARHINDPGQRVEAYVAVSERLAEDFKAISLFSDNYIIVCKSNVQGLVIAADDRLWFNDVTRN